MPPFSSRPPPPALTSLTTPTRSPSPPAPLLPAGLPDFPADARAGLQLGVAKGLKVINTGEGAGAPALGLHQHPTLLGLPSLSAALPSAVLIPGQNKLLIHACLSLPAFPPPQATAPRLSGTAWRGLPPLCR